jgi:hypothetical protein
MFTIILVGLVLIALYFIYKQISNLNTTFDKIILILNNNKEFILDNYDNISDNISNTLKEHNQSLLDPEYLMSKFMSPDSNNLEDLLKQSNEDKITNPEDNNENNENESNENESNENESNENESNENESNEEENENEEEENEEEENEEEDNEEAEEEDNEEEDNEEEDNEEEDNEEEDNEEDVTQNNDKTIIIDDVDTNTKPTRKRYIRKKK